MVDEKKLKRYSKKYEVIKESVVEASIIKGELERQQEISDAKLINLYNNINDEKAIVWFKKAHYLNNKTNYLKKELKINMVASLFVIAILISLGYFVVELPLALVSIISVIVGIVKTTYDIKKYNKKVRKCSIANISNDELKSNEITRLERKHNNELAKNNDIRKSIELVNNRLSQLAEVKIDIENLIICLFSNLDNIIKNQSTIKNPFETWLDISYVDDEPQLEIGESMKRIRYKKEEK